jgi:putative sterol carrier protein
MESPRNFFEQTLSQKFKNDPGCLKDLGLRNQSISVDVEGSNGGQWTLGFDADANVSLRPGVVSSDCTIVTNEKTFSGMMDGSVNVPMAFIMRKIKIKGDPKLAAKLGLALKKLV